MLPVIPLLILDDTSFLQHKLFWREGRSEKNWCHAVNSICSIDLNTLFGPDVLIG